MSCLVLPPLAQPPLLHPWARHGPSFLQISITLIWGCFLLHQCIESSNKDLNKNINMVCFKLPREQLQKRVSLSLLHLISAFLYSGEKQTSGILTDLLQGPRWARLEVWAQPLHWLFSYPAGTYKEEPLRLEISAAAPSQWWALQFKISVSHCWVQEGNSMLTHVIGNLSEIHHPRCLFTAEPPNRPHIPTDAYYCRTV